MLHEILQLGDDDSIDEWKQGCELTDMKYWQFSVSVRCCGGAGGKGRGAVQSMSDVSHGYPTREARAGCW